MSNSEEVVLATDVPPLPVNPSVMSTGNLVKRLFTDVKELVKTEVALAKAELKRDVRAEATAAKGLGAAALLGYMGVVLLFVTAIIGLGHVLPDWAAALLVSLVVLAAAGIAAAIGWSKRVRTPLARTRKEAKATLVLAKERVS
jgi:hypothetical protein